MGNNVIISEPAGQEMRSTDRLIYGAAVASLNNSVYIFGGYYNEPPWNMEALYHLPNTINSSELIQIPTDPFASPTLLYGQMVSYEGSLYTFGGHHPTPSSFESSTVERLHHYRFDFDRLVWMPLQEETTLPLERYWHSATVTNQHVYVFGGMNVTGPVADSFWQYDLLANTWKPMPALRVPIRCGHTASMISGGRMVVLGGYDCVGNYSTNPILAKNLADLSYALIFNTMDAQWTNQTLQGNVIPCPRAYHTAVATKDDWIVICGGQDGIAQPFQTYVSAAGDSSALTAMLDTNRWEWMIPPASPFQPFPRSFAVAAIVNDSRMVYAFGINYHTIYDGIYVFDIPSRAWLPSADLLQGDEASAKRHIAIIIGMTVFGVCVGVALFAGIWVAIKRYQRKICKIFKLVKHGFWKPRAGEPLWAEISRFFFRTLFLTVLFTVVIVLFLQVRNSPIIDQKTYTHNEAETVDVPDIRFCFDEWTSTSATVSNESSFNVPVLQCSTDFGDPCSQYVIDITNNIKTGLSYYGSKLTCYLFRAPTNFRLGQPYGRQARNGSYLKFYYYGPRGLSSQSRVHTVFYNKFHNPNLRVYGIEDPYGLDFSWDSPSENAEFQSAEQENLRTSNSFDLDPRVVSAASYQLIERQEMRRNPWNYVGVAARRDHKFELSSKAMSESMLTAYTTEPQPLGSLHVFPASYETIVFQEQRAFTLVNAMGIMGGISGLIIGLQACLFGYRPRSPWGVMHRWSVGQMRLSLLNGLRSRFPNNVKVPIVHPVHRRFSTPPTAVHPLAQPQSPNCQPESMAFSMALEKGKELEGEEEEESNEQRMERLEERLHVLELLFQSYYINDEIFRSLDLALHLETTAPDAPLSPELRRRWSDAKLP